MAGADTPTGLSTGSGLPDGDLAASVAGVEGAQTPALSPVVEGSATGPVARNAMIYGIATILSRATGFIMLPVYTHVLTPVDYGLLQMLDMTVDITALMISAGSMAGVMRFAYKATDPVEREGVISTAFILVIALNTVGAVLLAAASEPVWRHFLDSTGAAWYVRVAAANFAIGAVLVVPQLEMQMRGRATLFTITSVSKLTLQVGLNLFFLLHVRTGPVGILISTFVANALVGTAAAVWLFRTNHFRPNRRAALDLYRFGVPYQFATAGAFILTFGDRFFLQPARGLATVGIYSFAYQFGFLMSTVGPVPYLQAWTPHRYELARLPKTYRDYRYNVGFFYLSLISFTVAVGIGVLVHPMLRIMSKSAFLPAADLVPIILAAYIIQACGAESQFAIDISEQTRYSSYAVWTSVVVVLILYATLIPPFGGWGAAVATLLGFAVRAFCLYTFAQRLWHINYVWAGQIRLALVASAAVGASFAARNRSLVIEGVSMCVILLLYFVAAWLFVLSPERRAEIRGVVNLRRGLEALLTRT